MLYSDVLASAYDELDRRLHGKGSAPETGGTALAPVYTSGEDAATAVEAGTSASTSSSNTAPATYSSEARTFAQSIGAWPVFPDTVEALNRLKTLGYKLVILSNVDRAGFAHTRANLEHGFTFDEIITAEEIGSYKYVYTV
jgi:FMN phosphatase YigB (HAD superfamily)